MDWLFLLAITLMITGSIGTFLPVLPGVPIVFLGMLILAWQENFQTVSLMVITILGVLALLAFLVDFVLAFYTTKKAGASKYALWGLAIGSLLGLVLGGLGLFVGAILGALIGEYAFNRNLHQATVAGLSAGVGFVIAFAVKLLLLLLMLGIFAYAYF
jgi:uncharacterized protein